MNGEQFDEKLSSLPLGAIFAVCIAGLIGWLIIKAVVGAIYESADFDGLVTWAVATTVLLPVVAVASYKAGKAIALQEHEGAIEAAKDRAFESGHMAGRVRAQREIDRLEETHQERGNAFLKGAEKGLGIVEKMTTVRAQAAAQRPAVVLPVQPASPQITWRVSDSDEIIEV